MADRSLARSIIVPAAAGGAGAPTGATYITQTAHADLTAEQALASLATGYMKVTTATGVVSSQAVPIPIADGGTNGITATAAFDNLAPTTTQGDVIYHNGTDNVRLAKGTGGQFLKMNSGATAPEWGFAPYLISYSIGDSGGFNPAAATTYYAMLDGVDPGTNSSVVIASGKPVPLGGTINRAYVRQFTLGTNGVNGENLTYVLRKNDTTDSGTIATLDTDVDGVEASVTTLAFAVAAGDVVAVKITAPAAWTTAPTAIFVLVAFVVETP